MAKIHALLDILLDRSGSDLHVSIGYPPLIRCRGELEPIRSEPLQPAEVDELLFEILSEGERAKLEHEHDLDFAYSYEQRARFRTNYFYKTTGLAAVFRTIPSRIATLEELACPDAVRKLAERRTGLVLVTGPAGSGKSTTLASIVDHINKTRACHILTIEDPVEFTHRSLRAQVTHREIGHDAWSFASAIRNAGRENADVILVGELRGNETVKLALELAGSGILVLASVHSTSAAATVDRIISAFPADEQPQIRGMLAECFAAIVSQQLVKSANGPGRVAAHEVLLGSSALGTMIREGKTFQIPNLMQAGKAHGMQTMDVALERLVNRGAITFDAAMEKATDKEMFHKTVVPKAPAGSASP